MQLEDVRLARIALESDGILPSCNAIVNKIGGSKRDVHKHVRTLTMQELHGGAVKEDECVLFLDQILPLFLALYPGLDSPEARDRFKRIGLRQRRVLVFVLENARAYTGEVFTYESLREVMGGDPPSQVQLRHILRTPREFLFDFCGIWLEAEPLKGLRCTTEAMRLPILAKRRKRSQNINTKSMKLAATITPQALTRAGQLAYVAERSIATAVAIATDAKTVAHIEAQNHGQPLVIDLAPYDHILRGLQHGPG